MSFDNDGGGVDYIGVWAMVAGEEKRL